MSLESFAWKSPRIARASEVLAQAFHNHPLSVFILPRERARQRALRAYFRRLLRLGTRVGEVHASSPQMEAVALWWPPGQHAFGTMVGAAMLSLVTSTGLGAAWRGWKYARQLGSRHQRHGWAQYWYLDTLGVAPEHQNRGAGTRLLQPMLARLDAQRATCCLESPVERPERFYHRQGFSTVDVVAVPGTQLRIALMVRPPQSGCP